LNIFFILIILIIIKINKVLLPWGLGIGDWGLGMGIGPNPHSPIPNPQSPIPNPHFNNYNNNIPFIFLNI